MSNARVKLQPDLDRMPRFQLEDCIVQAHLGATDTWIVRSYIFDKMAQADLAAEVGWTRCTVSSHLRKSIEKIQEMAIKLYTD